MPKFLKSVVDFLASYIFLTQDFKYYFLRAGYRRYLNKLSIVIKISNGLKVMNVFIKQD